MGLFSTGFEGSERFRVEERLGSGTSGEVYRVYDRRLQTRVALKTLHRADPAALYRFKNEFRALADVTHRNLVELYELLADGDRWFFTMELVDGHDFFEHCRGGPQDGVAEPPAAPPPDLERLRAALGQLCEGLVALHRAGKLHCDVKPSNLRVTPSGRVVLLDFGLVQELFPGYLDHTVDAELAGTPAYMSPEQAAGERLSEASDWYSVGVVLYETLTGRRPFSGGFFQVLQQKQVEDPPPPRELVPELPADLDELCAALLARDPAARPGGEAVLRRLGGGRDRSRGPASASGGGGPLVGREWHLATLTEAFERCRRGEAVVAYVHGGSGMGKSALVDQFLKQLRADGEEVTILSGRCYERESVPYKALDPLIDALSRHLLNLPREEVEALLPPEVQALGRLFPSLRRVQAVMRAGREVLEIPDEREQKRRARTALRELVARLAARRPLVLYVDDLHWGDLDSADLISEMLRPPSPPPVLFIASYRSEEADSSPLVRALVDSPELGEGTAVREIAVEELDADDARRLAAELLGERAPASRAVAQAIARESGGNPYLVAELVHYALVEALGADGGGNGGAVQLEIDSAGMTLGRLILHRLEQLTPEAGRLLHGVAVAGGPIDLEVALQAAELGSQAQAAVTLLRGASLIRIRRSRSYDEIETYHTRIREEVAAALDSTARKRWHGALALALEASERADPETLAAHFREAGDREREARYAVEAAEKASAALAFDRAARLYRAALELAEHLPAPRRELLVKLGDALASSGRGAEAAAAYLEAVDGAATAEEALELRRRAAEQQMMSGHLDQGLATVREVLASIGMSLPRSPAASLGSILWRRSRLKLRGLGFRERPAGELPRERLLEIDACRSVAVGLANVDPVRGMDFATRHLLLALDAGEPYRVARALAIEAGFSSTGGTRTRERTRRLIETARILAERVGRPDAVGLVHLATGLAAYLEGAGRRALEIFEDAEETLRQSSTGVAWELSTLMHYKYRLLVFLGRAKRIDEELPAILKDMVERGDLYGESYLRSATGWFRRLAADQPEEAEAEIVRARGIWSKKGFHLGHYMQLVAGVEIALYRARPDRAREIVVGAWRPLVRSQLLRVVEITRSEAWHLRCRVALAELVAASGEEASEARRRARRDLRTLERQSHPWSRPFARLVHAGLASCEGLHEEARGHLVAAAAGFDAQHMSLYAAASHRRRGQLLGGARGAELVARADRRMATEGIRDPERFSNVLVPGAWSQTTAGF